MYQIRCDDVILYDPRDDELILLNPKCKLKVNTVGEGSFSILPSHPYYNRLQKLKSVFEIRQDDQVIFRGRMTNDSRDFYNRLEVDLEGALGYTNDSIIPPFNFPDDFKVVGNPVEYLLKWILDTHNAQVRPWQQLKLGNVTVSDPNGHIARSSEGYNTTWETLKSKLFDSALGGYLSIRYEEDGNYVDYIADFTEVNTQRITFGENLLDITNESDASETYSAILPIGKKDDDNGSIVTIAGLADGKLTDDLVKSGVYIYSQSAVEQYGWICAPIADSTWDDVTQPKNLQSNAIAYMTNAVLLSNTITITAIDLRFTDEQIQSFRIYRNILVDSPVHGVVSAVYPLTELDIDILNPQNTTITIGDTVRTMTDINDQNKTNVQNRVDNVAQANKDTVVKTVNEVISAANAGRMIWSGSAELKTEDAISLYESITAQTTGIVLVFTDGTNFSVQFIPKVQVALHPGATYEFRAFDGKVLLTINDTIITGNAANGGTFTLAHVLGV